MASVKSAVRTFIKPFLFKLLGKKGYKYAQMYGKLRDIKHRLVEEKEMELLPLIVKEGDTVIDVGANYAYYCERLSHLVKDSGRVYAFEPIPFTHDVCKMILNKLKLNNVELYNLGVSNKNEQVQFSIPKLDFGGISAGQAHLAERDNTDLKGTDYYKFDDFEIVDCTTVTLDSHINKDLKNISFVKIDVEGAEYLVLQGMNEIVEKFKPVILVEIQPTFLKGFNIDAEELKTYIKNTLGYGIYKYVFENKKVELYTEQFDDDNYILIHNSNKAEYEHLIS